MDSKAIVLLFGVLGVAMGSLCGSRGDLTQNDIWY
jgi:hypothetical protein